VLYGWGRFLYRRPGAFTLPMAVVTLGSTFKTIALSRRLHFWQLGAGRTIARVHGRHYFTFVRVRNAVLSKKKYRIASSCVRH